MTEEEILNALHYWTGRIGSQQDYNALVDWLTPILSRENRMSPGLNETIWQLVSLRREYPDLGRQRWAWSKLATAFISERSLELSRLLLDLADTDQLTISRSDQEAILLAECAQVHGDAVWADVAERVLSGSWRLQMELRGWFLSRIAPDVVRTWVSSDVQRARVAASMTPVGEERPTEIARFLLDKFGDDRDVASSLYATLVSGFWMGNESERITRQIEQLNTWRRHRDEPVGVRKWARETISSLERNRQAVSQREAETQF